MAGETILPGAGKKMGAKILIADEHEATRHSMKTRLRQEGWSILEASSPGDALDAVRSTDIDVALLCLEGLREEALPLIRGIKSLRPFAEVILLTAPEQIPLSIKGMKMGAFDDLMAPFDLEVLLARVRDALKQRRLNEKEGNPSFPAFPIPRPAPGSGPETKRKLHRASRAKKTAEKEE